uniref:C-type lectin domain-containing protein n=1 Tax=Sphenodon punctatus TaxID=8508 RepID=A0A8D0L1R1_SPHPU
MPLTASASIHAISYGVVIINPITQPSPGIHCLLSPTSCRPCIFPAFICKWITDKKYRLAVAVLILILIILVIALAASKSTPCPSCPPPIDPVCPDDRIGYWRKCYYFSIVEGLWNDSQSYCSLHGASLAVIDTQQNLDFLMRLGRSLHFWIGLRKELDQPWKWPNGTEYEYDNRFQVRGTGQCAYLDSIGLSSSRCTSERNFICSRPDECARRKLS